MSFKAAAVKSVWRFCRMEQPLGKLGTLGTLGTLGILVLLFCNGANATEDFCKDKSCPEYELVGKDEGFEVRNYSASEWITTRTEGNQTRHLWDAKSNLDGAGFQFHSDAWPVLITQTEDDEGLHWFLSYFVPPDTTKPENPNDKVLLETKPAGIVYVKVFDGSPSVGRGLEKAKDLQKDLKAAGKSFNSRTFAGAAYEGYLSWHHHNEIWIYAV